MSGIYAPQNDLLKTEPEMTANQLNFYVNYYLYVFPRDIPIWRMFEGFQVKASSLCAVIEYARAHLVEYSELQFTIFEPSLRYSPRKPL